MADEIEIKHNIESIYRDINDLILEKKTNVKKVVNDTIISLYWSIGKRLDSEITGEIGRAHV